MLWIWPEDRRHQTTSSTDLRAMAKIPTDTQPSSFKFDEPGDSVFSNSLEQIATVTAHPTSREGMVVDVGSVRSSGEDVEEGGFGRTLGEEEERGGSGVLPDCAVLVCIYAHVCTYVYMYVHAV